MLFVSAIESKERCLLTNNSTLTLLYVWGKLIPPTKSVKGPLKIIHFFIEKIPPKKTQCSTHIPNLFMLKLTLHSFLPVPDSRRLRRQNTMSQAANREHNLAVILIFTTIMFLVLHTPRFVNPNGMVGTGEG